jgi:signal transduction histidine kinase
VSAPNRTGLRFQILVALVLVTLGGAVSVGYISIWLTRRALFDERSNQVVGRAVLAGELIGGMLGDLPPAEWPARLARRSRELGHAIEAGQVVVLARSGQALWPEKSRVFEDDGVGASGAIAGLPPAPRTLPGGRELVVYAPLSGPAGQKGAVRLDLDVVASVDATLEHAGSTVVLLGLAEGLVLLVAAAWILRSSIVRPVRDLERAAGKVAAGDLSARVDVRGPGELGRLADAFERMTRSLREGRESLIHSEKMASVGSLAAGVAHEVGNPLAAILGCVETLLSDRPDKPISPELRKDMLELIRGETQRIHVTIQGLLAYARPPREELEAVELGRVVEGAVALCKPQARFRDVEIAVDLRDLPAVRAGANRLTQVLLNLLLNAADAVDGRGRVQIVAERRGERLLLSVCDDGPGVPAELRGRIFDPFFTTKDVGKGTGLGLSVSQSIVEGFGGKLRLSPDAGIDGRGARFEMELAVA